MLRRLTAAVQASTLVTEAWTAELRELMTTDWKSLAMGPDEAVAAASVADDEGYLMAALTERGRRRVREIRAAWLPRRRRAWLRGFVYGPRYVAALEAVAGVAGRAALAVMLDG